MEKKQLSRMKTPDTLEEANPDYEDGKICIYQLPATSANRYRNTDVFGDKDEML